MKTNQLNVHWNCNGKGKHVLHVMDMSSNIIVSTSISKKDAEKLILEKRATAQG